MIQGKWIFEQFDDPVTERVGYLTTAILRIFHSVDDQNTCRRKVDVLNGLMIIV